MSAMLRPTPNTRLAENVFGRTISSAPRRRGWRHPWFTEALWLPKKKAWVAMVTAGFVNGIAPVVRVSAEDLREARGAFFGQLIDAYSGEDEIAQAARLAIGRDEAGATSSAFLDVPLYENPPLGLNSWRKVGHGGTGRVPLFFQDRGVQQPPATPADRVPPPPPAGNRLLCACDVFLEQPRAALSASLELNPAGAVTGTSLVSQTLRMREKTAGARPRLQSGEFSVFAESQLNFRGAASLVADYEEQTTDRVKVSTVWMVSPPNAPLTAEPDATWQPFVQHNLFWNLSWSQPLLRDAVLSSDIFAPLLGTLSLLGGGAGFVWASSVTASINDAVQGAYNILKATSLAGSFWTATGGGTTSAWPETTPEPPKAGLDKAATAAAKARAASKARINRRLDPPFPHEGLKFNRALLSS
jgi:hypothetical protein